MLTVIHPALLAQFQVHKMADQRMDMFLSKQSSLDCEKKSPAFVMVLYLICNIYLKHVFPPSRICYNKFCSFLGRCLILC